MKKLSIIVAVMVLAGCSAQNSKTTDSSIPVHQGTVIDSSTARNALDWAGVYEGVLPCADCEGIKTTLTLNSDNSFKLEQAYEKGNTTYITKPVVGKFVWNKTKPLISFKDGDDTRTYFIGEGYATAYDMEGNPIQSQLNYTLKQVKVF